MSFDVVSKFEKQIAEFYGAPYAVAIDSCTHGIEICLRQQNIKKIIVPTRTYISIPFLASKLNLEMEWDEKESTINVGEEFWFCLFHNGEKHQGKV